jgi:OmpA-OmpF porin, OOP family
MRSILISSVIASLSLVGMSSAHADSNDGSRLYAGISLGVAHFDIDKGSSPAVSNDDDGGAFKLYGGYQLNPYLGAEVGYLRGGDIIAKRLVNGSVVTQNGQARSLYVAATGQFPISDSFSLNTKLGVARSEVSSDDVLPAGDTLEGKKTSFMAGVGAKYQVIKHLAIVVDFDRIHKISDRVNSNTITVGVRSDF